MSAVRGRLSRPGNVPTEGLLVRSALHRWQSLQSRGSLVSDYNPCLPDKILFCAGDFRERTLPACPAAFSGNHSETNRDLLIRLNPSDPSNPCSVPARWRGIGTGSVQSTTVLFQSLEQ